MQIILADQAVSMAGQAVSLVRKIKVENCR